MTNRLALPYEQSPQFVKFLCFLSDQEIQSDMYIFSNADTMKSQDFLLIECKDESHAKDVVELSEKNFPYLSKLMFCHIVANEVMPRGTTPKELRESFPYEVEIYITSTRGYCILFHDIDEARTAPLIV